MPWSRSRMPSSYAAPPPTTSSAGGSPSRSTLQPHVGDRAVDGVVLGSVRVRVDPADEVLARGLHAAAHAHALAGAGGSRSASGASCTSTLRPGPPSACAAPVQRQRPAGHPGRREPAELDPAERDVEPVAGRRSGRAARSSARRAGRPSCGRSSRASRRPRASRPSTRSDPSKRAAGTGLSSFVRGSRARYIQARGRWNSGGSELAKRRSHSAPSIAPAAAPGAHRRLPHSDPVAAAGGRSGQRLLVRARALGGAVEERHPERAVRQRAPGRLCTV